MAQFGSMGLTELEAMSLYNASFKGMAPGSCYYNPEMINPSIGEKTTQLKSNTTDFRPKMFEIALKDYNNKVEKKALGPDTGGAGTAGTVLIPVYYDMMVVDISRKFTPLVESIRRVTNLGLKAVYNRITSKGSAFFASPDQPLNDVDRDIQQRSQDIKYMYSTTRVLGPLQAAMPGYSLYNFQPSGDGMANTAFSDLAAPTGATLDAQLAIRALKELEEDTILNGDVATNPLEFNGLIQQQGTTNQLDLAGAELDWDAIEDVSTTIFNASGRPKIVVGSSSAIGSIRKLYVDTYRFIPDWAMNAMLPLGIPADLGVSTRFGVLPLIASQFLNDTAAQRQLWFFDTDYIEIRVVLDMTFMPLANTTDSQRGVYKMYECIINRFPEASGYIDNIA